MPEKDIPLNRILYGPPGTGKTYNTVDRSLEILDPGFLDTFKSNRDRLKERFDELASEGRIRFVTFHQSFSYEDFVEGIRAEVNEDDRLSYRVASGVFKELAQTAAAKVTSGTRESLDPSGRRVWKMSLGDTQKGEGHIFREAIDNGYILLGYGDDIDFSGCENREQIQQRFAEAGEDFGLKSYPVWAINAFWNKMEPGDLVVISEGNTRFRAIGKITGEPQVLPADDRESFLQSREVRWLRVYEPSLPADQLLGQEGQFSQMTLYQPGNLDPEKLRRLVADGGKPGSSDGAPGWPGDLQVGHTIGEYVIEHLSADLIQLRKPRAGSLVPFDRNTLMTLANHVAQGDIILDDIQEKRVFDRLSGTTLEKYIVNGYNNVLPGVVSHLLNQGPVSAGSREEDGQGEPWVLIIDEINRGNVSRIFGELITLLESDKREGQPEATTVELPYSREQFSVPANLYLIGTMNTADRSLTGLDVALRRRFTFEEIPPKPELLEGLQVEGIDIQQLLTVLNQRIEALLDRDHRLGHSYFLPLARASSPSLEGLEAIFRRSILPLLEEYFFEDWERIHWVLNDHNKTDDAYKFILPMEAEGPGQDPLGMTTARPGSTWRYNPEAPSLALSYEETIGPSAPEGQ